MATACNVGNSIRFIKKRFRFQEGMGKPLGLVGLWLAELLPDRVIFEKEFVTGLRSNVHFASAFNLLHA
jgi:ribosomal protein L16/L10AE